MLVVATAGGRPVDAIPCTVPSNARIASYLPFEWLLPRADVLVTNGGYGSVNQAMSFGIPLVTAGMTEDKADVNVRVARMPASASISQPTSRRQKRCAPPSAPCSIDPPTACVRCPQMANEFARIDTRSEIISIISEVVADQKATLRAGTMATSQPRRTAQQR